MNRTIPLPSLPMESNQLRVQKSCTLLFQYAETRSSMGASMRDHKAAISYIAFSSSGYFLISASFDKIISCWDVRTGLAIRCLLMGRTNRIRSVGLWS